ncbi:MAG TPA: lactonase family protein [Opitutaceae bacterium]|jgi:6-phosphogluconolactonase|nr:lactonase family protein [Opitutaceae bacterium]
MILRRSILWAVILCSAFGASATRATENSTSPGSAIAYVGGYTGKEGQGIYAFRFNAQTGGLTPLGLAVETANPSFIVLHPTGKYLYAVGFTGPLTGPRIGLVSAFAVNPVSSKLTLINQQSSGGGGSVRITINQAGTYVFVANYGTGSVCVLPVEADGRLATATALQQHTGWGPNQSRQEGPHAHSVTLDSAERFAFACDLGIDKVMIYQFDATSGTLARHGSTVLAPGSGPRHLTFSPDGNFAYVISEMLSTLTAFHYDSSEGKLTELQTISTLPSDWKGINTAAEVHVHPSGKFVYASNRGNDSIATYRTAPDGRLSLVGLTPAGGKTPRFFTLDPTGTWLLCAHQNSGTIAVFKIDPDTGLPKPVGAPIPVPSPTCIVLRPETTQ